MSAFPITTVTSEEELRQIALGPRLRKFNAGFIGEYQAEPIRLIVKDSEGSVAGGLSGEVILQWLRINVLWVEENARGNGLGTRLLIKAEGRAREMGAQNAWLETFEWQALGFYSKRGYEEFSRIDNYVKGYYLAYMKKKL